MHIKLSKLKECKGNFAKIKDRAEIKFILSNNMREEVLRVFILDCKDISFD